jgi:hypothetical protein
MSNQRHASLGFSVKGLGPGMLLNEQRAAGGNGCGCLLLLFL